MVDHHHPHPQVVCCMCGDVGFPDKLFRCNRCRSRYQHSYCSNYYSELSEPIEQCDWCGSELRSSLRHGGCGSSRKFETGSNVDHRVVRSVYSGGDKIKQHDREDAVEKLGTSSRVNPSTGAPSPRTATRRYKLLKDVMC